MNRSWNASYRLRDRIRACRWLFDPETYRARMDDTFDQIRHDVAARHLGMKLPAYLLFCAAYVFRHHHRDLAPPCGRRSGSGNARRGPRSANETRT